LPSSRRLSPEDVESRTPPHLLTKLDKLRTKGPSVTEDGRTIQANLLTKPTVRNHRRRFRPLWTTLSGFESLPPSQLFSKDTSPTCCRTHLPPETWQGARGQTDHSGFAQIVPNAQRLGRAEPVPLGSFRAVNPVDSNATPILTN
jgi:hypothetical protein